MSDSYEANCRLSCSPINAFTTPRLWTTVWPRVFRRINSAFATDKDETSQIAAVRLEERRFKRFDFTLLLQPSIFLNRLAEDLVRLSLTARYWSAETNENRSTGSHHDLPQSLDSMIECS